MNFKKKTPKIFNFMLTIKEIITRAKTLKHKSLTVGGWVQSVRQNKFIQIKDGSSLKTLQLVVPTELVSQIKTLKFGSYLQVQGQLILTPHQAQSCELKLAHKLIELRKVPYHSTDDDYNYLKYAFYGLITVCFISLLNTSWKVYQNE